MIHALQLCFKCFCCISFDVIRQVLLLLRRRPRVSRLLIQATLSDARMNNLSSLCSARQSTKKWTACNMTLFGVSKAFLRLAKTCLKRVEISNLLPELTSIYSPASTTIGVAIPVSTKLASLRSLHSTDRRIPKNIPE